MGKRVFMLLVIVQVELDLSDTEVLLSIVFEWSRPTWPDLDDRMIQVRLGYLFKEIDDLRLLGKGHLELYQTLQIGIDVGLKWSTISVRAAAYRHRGRFYRRGSWFYRSQCFCGCWLAHGLLFSTASRTVCLCLGSLSGLLLAEFKEVGQAGLSCLALF